MTTATYAPANQNVPANPQLAPYGFFGDLARTFVPVAGQAIGSVFGNQQLGGQLGNTLGGLAGLMPFGAQPGMPGQYQQPQQAAQVQAALAQAALAQQQQLAPYGFVGDLFRAVAPTGGQIIGGLLGDQQTGGQVGGILGQLGGLLPFGAQPGVPQTQLHPQQAQQVQQAIQAQQVQQAIQAQQVQQAIQAQQVQQAIQAQQVQQAIHAQQQVQQATQAQQIQRALAQQSGQIAPFGLGGDLLRAIGPTAAHYLFANPQTAQDATGILNAVAGVLPFSAQPGIPASLQNPQLAPYGFVGGALGNVLGGLGGSALGGLFGDSSLGGSIGSTAGSILGAVLPFQAQPGMIGSPWTSYQGMSAYRQPMSN